MISLLEAADAASLASHVERHTAESHLETPFMLLQPVEVVLASYDPCLWAVPLVSSAGAWQRVWAFRVPESAELVAHVVVTGNTLAPHRCTLGMGVERAWRRKGIGRRLMIRAIEAMRGRPYLRWIDGVAFEHNTPVLDLDYSVGFIQAGRVPDVLRWVDSAGVAHSSAMLVLTREVGSGES